MRNINNALSNLIDDDINDALADMTHFDDNAFAGCTDLRSTIYSKKVKDMIYHNNTNYFKWIFGPANWIKAESDFLLPELSKETKGLYEEAKTPETLLYWLQVDDEQTLSSHLTNMKMGK